MSSKKWNPPKISGNTPKEKIASFVSHVRKKQSKKRKRFDAETSAECSERSLLQHLQEGKPGEKNNVPQYLDKLRELVDLALEANKRQSKNQLRELALAFRELDVSTNLLYAWEHARGISCEHVIELENRIKHIKSNWKTGVRKDLDARPQ